jgi:hypothetical protein
MKSIPAFNESCAYLVSDRKITFYRCAGVMEYGRSRVALRLERLDALLIGNDFVMSSFEGSEITVSGCITQILLTRRS